MTTADAALPAISMLTAVGPLDSQEYFLKVGSGAGGALDVDAELGVHVPLSQAPPSPIQDSGFAPRLRRGVYFEPRT